MIEKSNDYPISEERAKEALDSIQQDNGPKFLSLILSHAMTCPKCGPKLRAVQDVYEQIALHITESKP